MFPTALVCQYDDAAALEVALIENVAREDLELLAAKDPEVRGELARRAVKEGWTVMSTAARAGESNEDQRAPRKKRQQAEYLDESVHAVAKAWDDVLRGEVQVRPMAYGQVRHLPGKTREADHLAVGNVERVGLLVQRLIPALSGHDYAVRGA